MQRRVHYWQQSEESETQNPGYYGNTLQVLSSPGQETSSWRPASVQIKLRLMSIINKKHPAWTYVHSGRIQLLL